MSNKRGIDNPYGKRNYRKEYDEYHGTREQKDNRNMRNKARRAKGLKKGDSREVDHKKPLSKGGSNGASNTRVVSRTANRKKYNGG
tara:strand:+ start:286 stop:543 length:258 start_codon:yes stop_codon:yes gene_type:complete